MSEPVRYMVVFSRDGRFVLLMCFRPMRYSEIRTLAIAKRLEKYGDFYQHEIAIREVPIIKDKWVISERCIDFMRVEDLSK